MHSSIQQFFFLDFETWSYHERFPLFIPQSVTAFQHERSIWSFEDLHWPFMIIINTFVKLTCWYKKYVYVSNVYEAWAWTKNFHYSFQYVTAFDSNVHRRSWPFTVPDRLHESQREPSMNVQVKFRNVLIVCDLFMILYKLNDDQGHSGTVRNDKWSEAFAKSRFTLQKRT